jgi:hypothetical protein|tara:strand:- start:195 stop:635 length:441 start_codon:yes stop_codon:yes gene_type:complete
MFFYLEYELDKEIIKKILNIIKKYKGLDCSDKTCTNNGFQTENIIELFNLNILKKIVPVNNLHEKIFHLHYIKYGKGGWQKEHFHEPDDLSFILYLNNSDGDTVLKYPVNKRFTPKKGKIIVFSGKISHYAEPSFKGKKVLVGAIK